MLFRGNLYNEQVGISQDSHNFCVVVVKNQHIQTQWFQKEKTSLLDISVALQDKKSNICKIQAISDRFIWRKYLFFPDHYSNEMIYRQIIALLKKELPIPLEDIYFDYQIMLQQSENVFRVLVYALKKSDSILMNDKKFVVLDSEYYCYQRGIHYLAELPLEESCREQGYFFKDRILQFKQAEFCQTPITKASQITHCKRVLTLEKMQNLEEIEGSEIVEVTLSENQQIVDPYLYVIALGASLWNGKGLT
ncbi:hypothetical protein [Phocoenobacter skyensis]|uniref:Competence protein ComA n=1 Tax=Phocoenobacter skyensis TaxID=97481 RepID=A0A1H7UXM8_9PAST|nr:hypothetical protein [Pasteurella skyensis]MDP8078553.1 hypothetical protein [Pasteurella skyensis]MDP8084355.1 hypothetical protein [Pasteurella skyensis]MDP8171331.1 hypothetical protein [Pasteurella skyensis]MDP8175550.1 hypothetical protein [Pasteurella skyensis]MDP8184686.1 hypothetical protein [Pasteurella skyensis]